MKIVAPDMKRNKVWLMNSVELKWFEAPLQGPTLASTVKYYAHIGWTAYTDKTAQEKFGEFPK